MKPIALLGGSFDPVHVGHVALARAAFSQLEAERLILLPAGKPYQKGGSTAANGEARTQMLRLAFGDDPDIEIDTRELQRPGNTYTYDTLMELRAGLGMHASLVWLVGADAFAKLDTWHRWRELFELVHFAVIARAGASATAHASAELAAEIEPRLAGSHQTHESAHGAVVLLATTPPPVSSTQIRQLLRAGQPIDGLTPAAVCDYIAEHHLYT